MLSRWIPNAVLSIPDSGPRDPGPLGCHVIYVPEATWKWWSYRADGSIAGMHTTLAQAQAALNVNGKEVSNG